MSARVNLGELLARPRQKSSQAFRDADRKEKGGAPEDARRGNEQMQVVLESNMDGNDRTDMFRRASPQKEASLWLDQEVVKARKGVTTQVVNLTPALAGALLARNPDNRKISARTVEGYSRDMSNGAWTFNGEPIILASSGFLNDGQHRCEAVALSGVTIPVVLVIGTSRASRLTVDQGKTRLAGDYLGMNGHADSVALASAAKYIWQHREFGQVSGSANMSPTKGEILSLIETTPTIAESLADTPRKGSDAIGGRSLLAFLHWTFMRVSGNKEAVKLFFESLFTGSNLVVRSPILYTRNRLMAERGRLKPNEKAELVIRAWNASRRGDKVASMPIKGGALPAVER